MDDIQIAGREILDGRSAVVVTFRPKPGYKAQTKGGKVLQKLAGRAWVDEDEHQLVRIDAELLDALGVGPAGVFRLQKGARASLSKAPRQRRDLASGRGALLRRREGPPLRRRSPGRAQRVQRLPKVQRHHFDRSRQRREVDGVARHGLPDGHRIGAARVVEGDAVLAAGSCSRRSRRASPPRPRSRARGTAPRSTSRFPLAAAPTSSDVLRSEEARDAAASSDHDGGPLGPRCPSLAGETSRDDRGRGARVQREPEGPLTVDTGRHEHERLARVGELERGSPSPVRFPLPSGPGQLQTVSPVVDRHPKVSQEPEPRPPAMRAPTT